MKPLEVLLLVISRLDRLRIAYMVCGSFASAAHGVPRSTVDADLVVELSPVDAGKLVDAFREDFYVDLGQVRHAISAKTSFNIIHLETFFKTDLFILADSKFAREQFSRRTLEPIGGPENHQVYIATTEDTILSKLDWYRRGGQSSAPHWPGILGRLNAP